ncbi:MAG TPA: hypothetical protein VMM12_03830 [Longimicrobiales bacterium]|nr:hypothetical protein [Longimicrobiales bacterium]
MKRGLPLLLTLATLACGEDPAGTGEPFEQTITGTITASEIISHTVTAPREGTLRAVLTWPDGQVDLDLYLTAVGCTGYPPQDCTLLDSSDSFTGTQETVSGSVTPGQQSKLWVDSWSAEDSGYTIEVTID